MIFKKQRDIRSRIGILNQQISTGEKAIQNMQKEIESLRPIITDDIYITKSNLQVTIYPVVWEEE